MVRKSADVRRHLERHLGLWQQNQFDLLVQEAERCDRGLRKNSHFVVDEESVIHVFTRPMLCGRVRAAVHWATERTKVIVLSPSDTVEGSTTVIDVLHQKHPVPRPPGSASLLRSDLLPQFEDEITGGHILCAARKIQGGAGPSGCDACHWQDALLRYGAHSARLHDAVAALTRRLASSITPWNDICALVSNRLIALHKCPGVRPVALGRHFVT